MNLQFTVKYAPAWGELIRMKGFRLALLGNKPALGLWSEQNPVLLHSSDFKTWTVQVHISDMSEPLEYKYVLFDRTQKKIVAWENGMNRHHSLDGVKDTQFDFFDENIAFDIPYFRGAGVAIPVFSLRTDDGFGVGEFLDLKKMIDWAATTGQQMIQLLPVNDTTLQRNQSDSYPYNTLSVFALHPMYLRLQSIGEWSNMELKDNFEKEKKQLNAKAELDYETVNKLKWKYFSLLYNQEKKHLKKDKVFAQFKKENESWLVAYSVFSFFRDKNNTANFSTWSKFSNYDQDEVSAFYNENIDKLDLYSWLQYQLHLQLSEVHEYAQARNILLKGDIPIGVSPLSVDVWCSPQLFHRNVQAGAPPDSFSEKGQNWGFPTYNWDEMQKDDFAWWKARLQHMSRYFDAYRIDHILGFFRIWEIPTHAKWGLLGQFYKSLPMTAEEIKSYGFELNTKEHLQAFISDKIVDNYFGNQASFVKEFLLEKNKNGNYQFREDYDTQAKILDFFAKKNNLSEEEKQTKEAILRLHCQLLFLEDKEHEKQYHPRISLLQNEAFEALNHQQQIAYERIYEEYFYRRHNEFWKDEAIKKLSSLVSATAMLSCGEDLGMIPASVPEVMSSLDILSLEIQRMPKTYGHEFGSPYFAPYMSVCTTSTHDMSPLRLWWEEDSERSQRFFNTVLFEQGEAPAHCEVWIVEKILSQHLQSPAMWAIFPIQDWLAMDAELRNPNTSVEQINYPDNPDNLWNYRMHISLNDLLAATDFNQKVNNLVEQCRN